jgi:TRAP-type C4-dicarboxylate transport system permease small subunit
MSAAETPPPPGPADAAATKHGWLGRLAFYAGAVGLCGAMAVVFAAVVGRRLGHPIPGATEIVQGFIVLAASSALIAATLAGSHAAVHLVTERLPPTPRRWLARLADLLGAVLFAALCAGGLWILHDTWGGDEASDLLGLPIAPLRLLWAVGTGAASAIFLVRAVRPGA